MRMEVILFILRVASASLLLSFLGAIFYIIWKDYRMVVSRLSHSRQSHGQLIDLQQVDGEFVAIGESYPLLPLTCIGRSPTNNIVIKDTTTSAEHAQVVLRNGQWWLEDRNSRNGTMLNEIPIVSPVVMTDGDVIGIGTRRLRLRLEH